MSEIGQGLIQAVRKAAAERPNYVYHKPRADHMACMYVYGGQPSCLVGKAAWELGLIGAAFEEASENTAGVSELVNYLGLNLDDDELTWLETAQNEQDTGNPWGKAVQQADYELADLDMRIDV